jgi:hypothetical protein
MRNWSIKAGAIAGLTATTAACSVYAGMVILEALPAATAFATTTATTSATAASSPRGQQVIQEIQSAFRPGKWLEHFMRHGEEFLDLGVRTSAQYLQRAQTLLGGAPGISTFVRAGGDKLFYRAATNEFLVVSKDNIIRTFFRPENGILYWFQETGQLLIQK